MSVRLFERIHTMATQPIFVNKTETAQRESTLMALMPFIVIALILAVSFLAGCQQRPSADTVARPTVKKMVEPALLSRADIKKDGAAETLRFKFADGAQLSEVADMSLTLDMSLTGAMSLDKKMRISTHITLDSQVDAVSARGANVSSKIVGFKMDTDQPVALPDYKGARFSTVRTASGNTADFKYLGGADMHSESLDAALKQGYASQVFELPERAVKPGDTWTATKNVKANNLQGVTLELAMTATYVGDLTRNGRRLAVVRVDVKIGGGGSVSQGPASGYMKANGRSLGVVLFDIARGIVVESKHQATIAVAGTIRAQGQSVKMMISADAVTKEQTVLKPSTAKAKPSTKS